MKKLTDEGKVLTMFAIIMLWCAITSLSGHSESGSYRCLHYPD